MNSGGTNTSRSLTTTPLVTKTMNGQNPTPDLSLRSTPLDPCETRVDLNWRPDCIYMFFSYS